MANNTEQPQKQQQTVKIPTWLFIMMLCMFFILTLILLNLRFFRYGLIGKSLDRGDITSTALLLTPEITTGLARLF